MDDMDLCNFLLILCIAVVGSHFSENKLNRIELIDDEVHCNICRR